MTSSLVKWISYRAAVIEWAAAIVTGGMLIMTLLDLREHVGVIDRRLVIIEEDLSLGSQQTTTTFRAQMRSAVDAIQIQVLSNATIMRDISDRLAHLSCGCGQPEQEQP